MRLCKRGLVALLLAGAALALYWPSLHNPTCFDDVMLLEGGRAYSFFLNGFSFSPRWLPYITIAWVEVLFDDGLFVQRLFNLGLHLITAYVLYRLVIQVSDYVAPHRNNTRAAFAAAPIFLLHPLAVYAVGYIIQRSILMATLFGLLSISAYFEGLVKQERAQFWFAGMFYLLSAFSKEHAVLVPAAALALTPLAGVINRQMLIKIRLPVALFLMVSALVAYLNFHLIGQAYEPFAQRMVFDSACGAQDTCLWVLSVLTQATLYFKYLGLMLWPDPVYMSIDIRLPVARGFDQTVYWLGFVFLIGYCVAATMLLFRRGRLGLLGYALLAPLLLFAVEFSAVRVQEPFVLYRTYLWLPLLLLALPVLSNFLPNKSFWVLLVAVGAGLAWASNDRLHSFSSVFRLWDDAAKKLSNPLMPGAGRIYVNRGEIYLQTRQYDLALADYSRAVKTDPQFELGYRGKIFSQIGGGDLQGAAQSAQVYLGLQPNNPDVYKSRGHVRYAMGDMVNARLDFERGCVKDPFPQLCVEVAMRLSSKIGVREAIN